MIKDSNYCLSNKAQLESFKTLFSTNSGILQMTQFAQDKTNLQTHTKKDDSKEHKKRSFKRTQKKDHLKERIQISTKKEHLNK